MVELEQISSVKLLLFSVFSLLSTTENETCPFALIKNSPVRITNKKILIILVYNTQIYVIGVMFRNCYRHPAAAPYSRIALGLRYSGAMDMGLFSGMMQFSFVLHNLNLGNFSYCL